MTMKDFFEILGEIVEELKSSGLCPDYIEIEVEKQSCVEPECVGV